MLHRNAADIAAVIEILNSVLIQILRLGYFGCFELDIQRVSVLKIFDVHGVNDRSKNTRGLFASRVFLSNLIAVGFNSAALEKRSRAASRSSV